MMTEKTTLASIWNTTKFNSISLAGLAQVNVIVVNNMLVGKPVVRWQAEEVLKALSQLIGEDCSLDTVEVVLYPEGETNATTPTNTD